MWSTLLKIAPETLQGVLYIYILPKLLLKIYSCSVFLPAQYLLPCAAVILNFFYHIMIGTRKEHEQQASSCAQTFYNKRCLFLLDMEHLC